MASADLSHPPKRTTYVKPRKDSVRKALTIVVLTFVLLVIPATVNVALTSQDTRNSAQVISDSGISDVRNNTTVQTVKQDDNILGKIYPFGVGMVILVWGGLIFIYLGTKFRKKL